MAIVDKTAQQKVERGTDRLREEFLATLASSPLLGTSRGGGVAQFGFPSAADLLGTTDGIDFNGESELLHVKAAAQAAPLARIEEARSFSPLEHFANMVEFAAKQRMQEAVA